MSNSCNHQTDGSTNIPEKVSKGRDFSNFSVVAGIVIVIVFFIVFKFFI